MKFRTLAILTALAALLLVAGCGGGNDSSSTASTVAPLTKDEFIAQADKICTDGDTALTAAQKDAGLGPSSSEADVTAFVTGTLVPNLEDQATKISLLGPPTGDEDQVAAIVTALQAAIQTVKDDPSSIVNGTADFSAVDKLAQDYGLKQCGAS